MPNYGVPNLIRATAVAALGGNDVMMVLHFLDDLNVGFTAATTAFRTPLEAFLQRLIVHQNTGLVWERIEFEELDSNAPAVLTTPVVGGAGLEASTLLPRQSALVISWSTGVGGRRRKGRTFVGGFTEANNDTSGVPDAAMVADIEDAARDFIAAADAADVPLVVLSRGGAWLTNGNVVNEPTAWAPFATRIVEAAVDARWDTQRRRRLD